jgi:hypothetical protein
MTPTKRNDVKRLFDEAVDSRLRLNRDTPIYNTRYHDDFLCFSTRDPINSKNHFHTIISHEGHE